MMSKSFKQKDVLAMQEKFEKDCAEAIAQAQKKCTDFSRAGQFALGREIIGENLTGIYVKGLYTYVELISK